MTSDPNDDYGIPRSSSGELRNFKRSTIWRDMLREIELWEQEGLSALRDPRMDEQGRKHQDIGDVRYCQGGLDITMRLKNLLDAMIDIRVTHEENEDAG